MLVSDYIHPTPHGGECRIRIFERSGALPVVVATEAPGNPGQSIANCAERIAAEVLAYHPGVFDPFGRVSLGGLGYDKPFVWVEHYEGGARGSEATQDPATFDLVEFSHYEPRGVLRAGEWRKEIGEPSRSALDRASVEALVGEPLERG
jgi:hypothetical protein